MGFGPGDKANCIRNGKEIEVTILGDGQTPFVTREPFFAVQATGTDNDSIFTIAESKLLPLRGPYFAVRGLVSAISPEHKDEAGEIISIGYGLNKRQFFKIRFSNGETEWFPDDQVFIEHERK